jgi:hypothetical protein
VRLLLALGTKMISSLCVLCGKRKATTREHVPPRAIFAKPRPSDLITVPSCFKCNNESSITDESFKVHLGLHVWNDEQALRTLNHNTKLRAEVASKMKLAKIVDAGNNILDEVPLGLWDNEAHSITIEKCIRGLYFHHYDYILREDAKITTHYFNSLTPELIKVSESWAGNDIGNGDFVYKYTSASKENIHMSVWLFQFFGAHWAGGQTEMSLVKKNA